jgi:hypothetical protein
MGRGDFNKKSKRVPGDEFNRNTHSLWVRLGHKGSQGGNIEFRPHCVLIPAFLRFFLHPELSLGSANPHHYPKLVYEIFILVECELLEGRCLLICTPLNPRPRQSLAPE